MIDFSKLHKRKGATTTPTHSPLSSREITLNHYSEYTQMTQPSGFDGSLFMSATFTEPSVRRPPLPAGIVLRGTIGEPKFRQTQGTKETNRDETYTWLDLPIEIDLPSQNPSLAQQIGTDKVTLTWSCRIDLAEGGRGFDMAVGKNNGLRQVREAVDLNKPGDTFAVPMLHGRVVLCKISNRPYQGEVFDGIDSLARAV